MMPVILESQKVFDVHSFRVNWVDYCQLACPRAWCWDWNIPRGISQYHYSDVIMSTMASQTISLTIVYLGTDQRKHQSPASLAFVMGIHRWPVNSPRKGPVTREMVPFDDVIMLWLLVAISHVHRLIGMNVLFTEEIPLRVGVHITLPWRHNERDCVSNHQRLDCFLSCLFCVLVQIKENIKVPCHWLLWVEVTCGRWIPLTKG